MNEIAPVRDYVPMTDVGMRSGGGHRIAPQNLAEVVKFAEVMSRADIALPKHLRGNAGACMAVALQALDWQMNPFAVASKSYAVNGVIAYEAQLIAAVVNTRSGIKGRLQYSYDGTGGKRTCTVSGMLDGMELTYTTPEIGSITVKNSPLWKSDPDQQLGYFAARSWARRHCPEVILGVYDRDEAQDMRDITPPAGSGLAERLQGANGGFNAEGVETALAEAVEGDSSSEAVVDHSDPETPADDLRSQSYDQDAVRAGSTACVDGEAREAPDDFTPEQTAGWLYGYDQTAAAIGGR